MNPSFGSEGQPPSATPSISSMDTPAPEAASSPESTAESKATPIAWQPFTFGGVAAFSTASLSRVLMIQVIVALLVGASMVRFVDANYSPVIVQAIQNLPEEAVLRYGRLGGVDSQLLAEKQFLSLAIDLEGHGEFGQSADFQVEFHRNNFHICSPFRSVAGAWEIGYPAEVTFSMNPSILDPWWGAWHPILYVAILLLVSLFLLATWGLLALLYMIPVRVIGWYADRQLTLAGAWRVASAALMPGAFTMIAALFLYGWQVLDLIGLGAFLVIHLLVGWVYLLVSPFRIKQVVPEASKVNPFV